MKHRYILDMESILSKIQQHGYESIHIHHTGGSTHDEMGEGARAAIRMRQAIKNEHVNNQNWLDIGYHLLLMKDGIWVKGRSFHNRPASIRGHNSGAFAIAVVGNFETDKLQGEQLEEITKLISELQRVGYEEDEFLLHREASATACPGTNITREKLFSYEEHS